jgi:hypothetical protein
MPARSERMQLWTYQPLGFCIDDLELIVNPKLGSYWNDECWIRPRYREMLPKLIRMLGTDQFLWCCTAYYTWFSIPGRPVEEWELNIPESQILAFIREPIWGGILRGDDRDLASIIVAERPVQPGMNITALVRVPLLTEWVTCRGKVVKTT